MRNFLLLAFGLCAPAIAMAAMFSWTDQSGNLTYGDKPPEGVAAKEITPPKLTVLENFANRYESAAEETKVGSVKNKVAVRKPVVSIYKKLSVIAPKQGQSIRANDGDVSVAISLSPKLQKGHKLIFTLDGKKTQQGTSTVANMTNLDRGEHALTVSVIDQTSKQLMTSDAIKFVVLRAVASKKKPFNPYETE